ncbi:MAG: GDSL-type esterase/lipase family protein, partial [Elusimicrobiota bacterium]
MKRFSPRKRVSFIAAIAVSLVAATEGASYVLFYWEHRRLPHEFAASRLRRPESHYRTDHPYLPYIAEQGRWRNIRFNSLGDRGAEPDRPKRRIRLVCYGGSTTFDMAHDEDKTWPGMLQRLLGEERYEVINAAQNGATSADTLVNFALIHADLKPDYLLVLDGINDLESSFQTGFRPDYSHRRRKIPDVPFPILDALPGWLDYSALWVQVRWALTGDQRDLHELYTKVGAFDYQR